MAGVEPGAGNAAGAAFIAEAAVDSVPGGAEIVPGAPEVCFVIQDCALLADLTGCSHGAVSTVLSALEITDFSPNCCMNDMYSLSMAAASSAVFFFCVQSRVGCDASPQIAHLTDTGLNVSM